MQVAKIVGNNCSLGLMQFCTLSTSKSRRIKAMLEPTLISSAIKSYPTESMFNAFRKLNTKSLLASGYLRIFQETSHNSPICNLHTIPPPFLSFCCILLARSCISRHTLHFEYFIRKQAFLSRTQDHSKY